MAVALVGTGSGRGSNNAALSPVHPTGWSAGNLLLVVGTIRHNTATLSASTGWSTVEYIRNVGGTAAVGPTIWYSWRIAQASETTPTFTPAGGVAGADVLGLMTAWSDVDTSSPFVIGTSWSSGADTTVDTLGPVPGVSIPANGAGLLLGAIADDTSGTGPAVPTGWNVLPMTTGTGINGVAGASIDATAGSDVTLNAFYRTATTTTATGNASWAGNTTGLNARCAIQMAIKPSAAVTTLSRLRLGSNSVSLRLGNNAASAAYLGSVKVWP